MVKLLFGIPDSQLAERIKDADVPCTSEEQAMAIAAGCIVCGKEPEVYMQNSGLGRIGDVCMSLYKPYQIPYPKLLLSIRHSPEHHKYMGRITRMLLTCFQFEDVEIIEQEKKC